MRSTKSQTSYNETIWISPLILFTSLKVFIDHQKKINYLVAPFYLEKIVVVSSWVERHHDADCKVLVQVIHIMDVTFLLSEEGQDI